MNDDDLNLRRPGGLTALAIINFVYAGLVGLSLISIIIMGLNGDAMIALMEKGLENDPDAEQNLNTIRTYVEAVSDPVNLTIGILLGVAVGGLLIISGLGYLKQQRFRGRTLGNIFAILMLASLAFSLYRLKIEFGILNMLDIIYPALTLFLVNVTFKDDLVK